MKNLASNVHDIGSSAYKPFEIGKQTFFWFLWGAGIERIG